jgi:hypothetical protein
MMATPEWHELIFWQLGLGQMSWYVLDFDTQWTGRKPGDIDILGGPLLWVHPSEFATALNTARRQRPDAPPLWREWVAGRSLALQGGIAWPPSLEYLVALEVKCSYFEDD